MVLEGTGGADAIAGSGAKDWIGGQGGDDTLLGLGGNDMMSGDDGDDLLDGGFGSDEMLGDAGDDTLIGGGGNDRLFANAGSDRLLGGDGGDLLVAGDGGDYLDAGDGDDVAWTGSGINGDSLILMGAGNDSMNSSPKGRSSVRIDLGDGDDQASVFLGHHATVVGGLGDDHIDAWGLRKLVAFGGAGDDVFHVSMDFENGSGLRDVRAGGGVDEVGVSNVGRYRISLGKESDLVRYQQHELATLPDPHRFSDFETGDGGDVYDLGHLLEHFFSHWDPALPGDPFAIGMLRLVQEGSKAILEADFDREGTAWDWAPIAIFARAEIEGFTAFNLVGYDPDLQP